ncbi:hypothetical protein F7725_023159 [Dissostichus mawsoni]|uniref:Uncharacterized protein n=1 Tax=Dissostichus mawsoni TaxID=36200 RepID=A0A7J5YZW9_DISMA|nr:hypothetical protein F7725_023159 [Dissostichus mawsoni]
MGILPTRLVSSIMKDLCINNTEDWYSGTSKELRGSLSMDWEMSWSSSMPPRKSSSAQRGLPSTESSRGEGGW